MADDPEDDGPGFPAAVWFAGLVWAGYGGALLALAAGVAVYTAVTDAGLLMCGAGFLAVLGWPLVWNGRQVMTGRAEEVNGFAIVMLVVPASVAAFVTAAAFVTGDAPRAVVVTVSLIDGFAVALAVPGVLALGGRRQYLAWRDYHRPDGGCGPGERGT